MNESLKEVPTLDSLVSDPNQVFQLSPETARGLLGGLVGVLPALVAQASRDTNRAEAPAVPEKWLTVDEVVSQFGVTVRWLYRHKRHLPHSQPTRKTILFPEERLRRWFAARKAN